MSDITNDRLQQLREAKNIVSELDEELNGQGRSQVRAIRSDLQRAGANIRASSYERYMKDALGKAAGIAIASDLDELADRATRVLDGEGEQ